MNDATDELIDVEEVKAYFLLLGVESRKSLFEEEVYFFKYKGFYARIVKEPNDEKLRLYASKDTGLINKQFGYELLTKKLFQILIKDIEPYGKIT